MFRDFTDWSVVEPNGFPDYRYNDREVIRAFADNSAATFEFLVAHGVVFVDKAPDKLGGGSRRQFRSARNARGAMDWPMVQTGQPADPTSARRCRPATASCIRWPRRRAKPASRFCSSTG